jgi:hypothetical protein
MREFVVTRSRPGSTMVVVGTLILVLAGVPFALGQAQDPQPSSNPMVFKAQLAEASVLAKRTLRELKSLRADDSTPLDPTVLNHARQTYVLIRAVRHGMGLLQLRQSVQDPVLEVARQRVEDAQNLARTAIDGRDWPRAEYLPKAISDLSKSVRLLDQAMMIVP